MSESRRKTKLKIKWKKIEVSHGGLFLVTPGRRTTPKTRGDCMYVQRPCLHLLCRYNLLLRVRVGYVRSNPNTSDSEIKTSYWLDDRVLQIIEGKQVRIRHSCALDLAEMGGMTLEQIGDIIGVSRERVRQIEMDARRKMEASMIEFKEEDAA